MKDVFLTVTAAFMLMQSTYASEEVSCQSGWAFQLYKACENPSKPIPKKGTDANVCGTESVTVVNDRRCPPIYKVCPVQTQQIGNWQFVTVIIGKSRWLHGDADNGQNLGDWHCKQVVNQWNSENRNPLQRANPIKFRPELEERKRKITHSEYRYVCDLQIEQGQYLTEDKSDPSCGIEGYENCTIQVANNCIDEAFATEYEKDRRAECGPEDQWQVGHFNTTWKQLQDITQNTMNQATCLSCEDTSSLSEQAKCIADNYMEFEGIISPNKKIVQSYLQGLITLLAPITDANTVELPPLTKIILDGLKNEIDREFPTNNIDDDKDLYVD